MLAGKTATVWILGFCTFAVALTTFHALLLQTQYGPTATFETYLLSPFVGPIQVSTYFLVSLTLTCALFGVTSFAVFRYSIELDTLMKLSSLVDHNTKQFSALLSERTKTMEEALKQSLSESLGIKIANLIQEIKAEMGKQKQELKALEKRLKTKPI